MKDATFKKKKERKQYSIIGRLQLRKTQCCTPPVKITSIDKYYIIWDRLENRIFIDEDGEPLLFDTKTEAKNYLFSEQYKPEWVEKAIKFLRIKYEA